MVGLAKIVQRHSENVTDPRVDHGCNHDLLEMVFVALTAAICEANGWADVKCFAKANRAWFLQNIDLPHGVPSQRCVRMRVAATERKFRHKAGQAPDSLPD